MNNLRMNLMLLALSMIFGCAINSFGQQTPVPQMTGAYSSASVRNKEVVAAANFAVKAEAFKSRSKIKLITLKCAQQQVVAGMNYRIYLTVQISKNGRKRMSSQTVEAVVYKNLKQKYSLTSWAKGDCPQQ